MLFYRGIEMENFGPDLKGFIKISKFAGERFDLIQAGGGNTSVKIDDSIMLVKASGYALSDVEETIGYAKVNHAILKEFVQNRHLSAHDPELSGEDKFSEVLVRATFGNGVRPSIETLMHSLMGKFVLHAHPLAVNIVVCRKNWREDLQTLFPQSLLVEYHTPGVNLAITLKDTIANASIDPELEPLVVFLQNHGIIVSAPTYEQVIDLIESILDRIEQHLDVDYSRYRSVTKISSLANNVCHSRQIAYLSEDLALIQAFENHADYFMAKPFFPDMVVYNGVPTLVMNSLDDERAVDKYFREHNAAPKIVLCDGRVYFLASTVRKAQALESIVKFQVLTIDKHKGETNYLSEGETNYLAHWEAEKFRSAL